MSTRSGQRFDFDDWASLAREDAAAFEARRRAAIAAVIESASPEIRPRLEALQWRLDRIRERAASPAAASAAMSRLMWDRVNGPRGRRDGIAALRGRTGGPDCWPRASVTAIDRCRDEPPET